MGPEALAQVLRPLAGMFPAADYPRMLVGLDGGDDAAVYKINDSTAAILTVDFFTPIVDDPYTFGAIAAANAMSDVYAMGGEVVTAMNICAFPKDLPPAIIVEILRGGAEKVKEAGGILAGGHTIDDQEPKYGLSVMGFVHPERFFAKAGAEPGDVLFLTKPLGTGIITTAAKAGKAAAEDLEAATASMARLNRDASHVFSRLGVRGCTDITGFGFLGHAAEMARKSGVGFRFNAAAIPFLPGAAGYAEDWLFPGGTARNRSAYGCEVLSAEGITDELVNLLFTPETSGGLFAAVPAGQQAAVEAGLRKSGVFYAVVGEVFSGAGVEIVPG